MQVNYLVLDCLQGIIFQLYRHPLRLQVLLELRLVEVLHYLLGLLILMGMFVDMNHPAHKYHLSLIHISEPTRPY